MTAGKRTNRETILAVIKECLDQNYFIDLNISGKLKYGAGPKLVSYFEGTISVKTIVRICKKYFCPVPVKCPKRKRNKGGKRGRPAKVTETVRIEIDEIGQELANEYIQYSPKWIVFGLESRHIKMAQSTVYRYLKYLLVPKMVYKVGFTLVDGPVWEDDIMEPYELGICTFDPWYSDCYNTLITLWEGVEVPTAYRERYFNVQDNLEDRAEYAAMGGNEVLRYKPVCELLRVEN